MHQPWYTTKPRLRASFGAGLYRFLEQHPQDGFRRIYVHDAFLTDRPSRRMS